EVLRSRPPASSIMRSQRNCVRARRLQFLLRAFDDKKRFGRKRLQLGWLGSRIPPAQPESSSFAIRSNHGGGARDKRKRRRVRQNNGSQRRAADCRDYKNMFLSHPRPSFLPS